MYIIIDQAGLEMLGKDLVRNIDEQGILRYEYENKSPEQRVISTVYWKKLAIGQCWLIALDSDNLQQSPVPIITFHYITDPAKLRREGIGLRQLSNVLKEQLNLRTA